MYKKYPLRVLLSGSVSFYAVVLLLLVGLFSALATAQSSQLNGNFFYFFNGQTVGGWGLTLGDAENWVLSVSGAELESADKQVSVSRADYQHSGDALDLKWTRKQGKGQFAIYGSPINLTQLENAAALTMEIKIIKKPKSTVTLGMDCGYPCRGEMNIHKMLRDMKVDQWLTFPVPINCFSTRGADLSKINSPIMLATDNVFEIQIANIRLERLPEGAPSCAS